MIFRRALKRGRTRALNSLKRFAARALLVGSLMLPASCTRVDDAITIIHAADILDTRDGEQGPSCSEINANGSTYIFNLTNVQNEETEQFEAKMGETVSIGGTDYKLIAFQNGKVILESSKGTIEVLAIVSDKDNHHYDRRIVLKVESGNHTKLGIMNRDDSFVMSHHQFVRVTYLGELVNTEAALTTTAEIFVEIGEESRTENFAKHEIGMPRDLGFGITATLLEIGHDISGENSECAPVTARFRIGQEGKGGAVHLVGEGEKIDPDFTGNLTIFVERVVVGVSNTDYVLVLAGGSDGEEVIFSNGQIAQIGPVKLDFIGATINYITE